MATEGILSDQTYGKLQFFNAISGIALSVLGIATNLLSIRTFFSMGLNDGVTVSFLSLSISDLVSSFFNWASCVAMMLHAYEHFSGYLVCSYDPKLFIIIFANLCFMTYTVTVLNTMYLAITRCMCVVLPLRFRSIFSAKKSAIVAIACALVPIAITFPIFTRINVKAHQSNSSTLECSRKDLSFPEDREEVKDVVYLIILTIIPFTSQVIVFICMIVMIHILAETRRIRRSKLYASGCESTVYESKNKSSTGASDNRSTFDKASKIVRFQNSLHHLHTSLSSRFKSVPTITMDDTYNDNTVPNTEKQRQTNTRFTSLFPKKVKVMDTIGEWVAARRPDRQIHQEKTSNTSSTNTDGKTITREKAQKAISHREKQVAEQVILICAIFFLCNMPMIGMGIASMMVPGLDASFGKHVYVRMYYFLNYLRRVIEQFSSSINFFIYMKYNPKFRHLTWHFIKTTALVKLVRGKDANDTSLTSKMTSTTASRV